MKKRFGLLGEKLGHSYSPMLHGLLADYDYTLYPTPPEAVGDFLRHGDWDGLNVTIPYKQRAMEYCDELHGAAKEIGCVNTLVRGANGRIYGYNTDYDGFIYMAERAGISLLGRKVVILGSGGAALCAAAVARDKGASSIALISRQGEDNYENLLARHGDCEILINATPVGMFPHGETAPVSLKGFSQLKGVLDVIYNPLRTRLVLDARSRGIPACGGLSMLAAQAHKSAIYFTGEDIPPQRLKSALAALSQSVENMVLIGMPGCGKSSVGAELAARTGRQFMDIDALVEAKEKKSIPAILAQEGEAAFRDLESAALRNASAGHGLVIATGGGAVLRLENRTALRQNGRVYLLARDLSQLPTEGRPLSKDLATMYKARLPFYQEAADLRVDNNGELEQTADTILEGFYAHPCD